jgi:acetaldehyde dehydrogenase (acetylating)
MAEPPPPSPRPDRDRDLASVQQARTLARQARTAQQEYAEFSQEAVDAVVDAVAAAMRPQAEALARLAVDETGYGNVGDKTRKNLFAAERVHEFIRPMRTVGVVRRIEEKKIVEIAEPFGVVAAIIPSTNPVATAIYKVLISLKARCAIVLSPHPAAERCITRAAELMREAATRAGAPAGTLSWMANVTLEGTQELMRAREVAVILATGGMGLVRAAYSAGKPAYGVGPGNAPAYIERTADIALAVRHVVAGKTFDHGVLCSSENSVVVDQDIAEMARTEFVRQGAHFLSEPEMQALAAVLVTPQRLPNPALVGKAAPVIAERAGITVPSGTRVLIAPLGGVGRDFPLSIEKLCPVLSFYVVKDWREGCERCKEILRYGGMGHTMAIHSRDEEVILQFGLHKPAYRIVVNTPTTHGSIGLSTDLDPALTLGCGGFGGNITSDNITPRHLLNLKRLAYGVRPVALDAPAVQVPATAAVAVRQSAQPVEVPSPDVVRRQVRAFLAARGFSAAAGPASAPPASAPATAQGPVGLTSAGPPAPPPAPALAPGPALEPPPLAFVCEEDVRDAIRAGRRLRLAPRAIVTPAARDLADAHKVFTD